MVLAALAGPVTSTGPVVSASPALSLKVKKSISNSSVIKSSKITISKGAKTTVTIPKTSQSVCRIVGTSIRGLKKGSCRVTVTMTPKKGKKVSKTLTVKVS
jgi:hypothetical protein